MIGWRVESLYICHLERLWQIPPVPLRLSSALSRGFDGSYRSREKTRNVPPECLSSHVEKAANRKPRWGKGRVAGSCQCGMYWHYSAWSGGSREHSSTGVSVKAQVKGWDALVAHSTCGAEQKGWIWMWFDCHLACWHPAMHFNLWNLERRHPFYFKSLLYFSSRAWGVASILCGAATDRSGHTKRRRIKGTRRKYKCSL